ncbi:MAG: MerR family DNA-binding transcriptional regulator [Rubrimonas sp.]|uniref:MerR family transcriptional regulator n=1 Tax=Rubrimonas sp. TaxID=2036015 RepID=UPI002FDE64CA
MSDTAFQPPHATIGRLCAEFDVTPRTLRFYEQKGLLDPLRDGQRRLYAPRDVARLKLILRGRRFGFSLSEIGELLDLYDPHDGQRRQLAATLDRAQARLDAMRRQRAELDEGIAELARQIDLVSGLLAQRNGAARPEETSTNPRPAPARHEGRAR